MVEIIFMVLIDSQLKEVVGSIQFTVLDMTVIVGISATKQQKTDTSP